MVSTMSQQDHLRTRDVAEVLGTSIATVKRLALSGELPHADKYPTKTGGYLFDRNVVEMFARTWKVSA